MLRLWRTLSPLPAGKWIFSRLLGFRVPYTGSVRPRVEELRPGYARVSMRDRRAVRNHLHSIHAIALANLAEVTSGLAMIVGLPREARSIVTAFSIEYLKKARGPLVAECSTPIVDASTEREHLIESIVRDSTGDVVAKGAARWLVGPREDRAAGAHGTSAEQTAPSEGARDAR
ncbi:MAG TPA: hotdog fold domain-containing protein [Gemmatimonadaceae bacterium]|nr:hotdog fold domain-containing protein [Gemmatimonadaceae bacterium]